jgi:hypothetical protein
MKTINEFTEGSMSYNNGIVHIAYRKDLVIDENVLMNEIICRKKLTQEPICLLLDMTQAADITEGALLFASQHPSPENVKAIAVITRSGGDHIRAKLYSLFDKPNIPTRAFLNAEEANDWFLSVDRMLGLFAA